MIKAVLFDLDNTLTDTYSIKIRCIKESLKKMISSGLKMEFEEAYSKVMELYKKSDYESSNIFEDFLKSQIGKIDYKILAAGIVEYRKIRFKYVKPYPHAEKMLRELKKNKGIILGIFTDSLKVKAWIRLTSIKLVKYFDLVLTYDDIKSKKPSPKGFFQAIKILNLKPDEILFVGDIPHKDVLGAKKAGMKTALAKYGQFMPDSELPDYELYSPMDLIKIIEKENEK